MLAVAAHAAPAPPKPEVIRLERKLNAMGTGFTLDVYGYNAGLLEAAAEESFEEVLRLDQMMSNYIPDSELSNVNNHAADHPVTVSRELFDLVQTCMPYSRQSEGTFDITVGPLMKVWGFYKGTGHLPHTAEIRTALDRIGYQKVQLDPAHLTVHFRTRDKSRSGRCGQRVCGRSCQRHLASSREWLSSDFGGGGSIYAIGTPPADPRGWYIRIRDPKDG